MGAKSGGMSLVSSCLHKAAPHQIAFVLNIWIGGYGAQGVMAGRDATEKKRKGEADTIPHILRRDHPPPPVASVRERERETKGGRMDEAEGKSKTGRELHGIRHNSFPRYSPVSGANTPTPTPLPPPSKSTERVCSPSDLLSSILPAARYRLPNNLTDCSAHRLPAWCIRVLVSFQNLSEYPAILTSVERREGEKGGDLSRIARV